MNDDTDSFCKNSVRLIITMLVVLAVTSCSSRDPEEYEFLKQDDEQFALISEQKLASDKEINKYKGEILGKKLELDKAVRKLKASFKKEFEDKTGKIRSLRDQIAKNRSDYHNETLNLKEKLSTAQTQLSEVRAAMESVEKVMSDKETIGLEGSEYEQWQARLGELENKRLSLTQEIDRLQNQIELRRKKIKYL